MILHTNHFFIVSILAQEENNKYFSNRGWAYDELEDFDESDYYFYNFLDLCIYQAENIEYIQIEADAEPWDYYPQIVVDIYTYMDWIDPYFKVENQDDHFIDYKDESDNIYIDDMYSNAADLGFTDVFWLMLMGNRHFKKIEDKETGLKYIIPDPLSRREPLEPVEYINEEFNEITTIPQFDEIYFLNDSVHNDYFSQHIDGNSEYSENYETKDGDVNLFVPHQWINIDDDSYEYVFEPMFIHGKIRELHNWKIDEPVPFARSFYTTQSDDWCGFEMPILEQFEQRYNK